MRNYIRHPTSIPINVLSGERIIGDTKAQNLSSGGLSFLTSKPVKVGELIDFEIPVMKPDYQGRGVVVWLRNRSPKMFEVGMRFTSNDDFFRTRMVEQVCQIEDYRQRICANYGRTMSVEEAAMEWIAKYAQTFARQEE